MKTIILLTMLLFASCSHEYEGTIPFYLHGYFYTVYVYDANGVYLGDIGKAKRDVYFLSETHEICLSRYEDGSDSTVCHVQPYGYYWIESGLSIREK